MYIVISVVQLSKISTPSQKPTPVLGSTRQYRRQYLDFVKHVMKWKLCEILNILEKLYSICFHVPVKFSVCLIIPKTSSVYKRKFDC